MQLLFDLRTPKQIESPKLSRQRMTLRRAAVKWLLDDDVQWRPAIGIDVPARGSSCRVDVAAAWLASGRAKLSDGRTVVVTEARKTAIVLCAIDRHDCWPECANADQILGEIAEVKKELCALEATIRVEEPELCDRNVLFAEYAVWNYRGTRNKAYHQLMRHLGHLETALFKGSRLARISSIRAANRVYLAIPKGVLAPEEVLASWGLLEVDLRTLETRLLKEPEEFDAAQESRDSLALNIADCNTRQLTDSFGLKVSPEHPVTLVKMPTYHRHVAIKNPNHNQDKNHDH